MTCRRRLVLAAVPLAAGAGAYLLALRATPPTPPAVTRATTPVVAVTRPEPAPAPAPPTAPRPPAPAAVPTRPALAPPPVVHRATPSAVAPAPRPVAARPQGGEADDCPAGPPWHACRVTLDEGGGRVAGGSGTPVHSAGGKTLVLTNAHVIPADRRDAALSVSAGGRTYPARFVEGSGVTFDPDGRMAVDGPDLCLLEVDADLGAVPVGAAVGPGEAVSQAGYGGTRPPAPPVVRRGQVTAAGAELALSYPVEPGDSGSGVLNAAGELVGVTVGRDPQTHRGSAVPAARVRAFLLRPRLRARFPELAERLGAAGTAGTTPPPPEGRPVAADGLPPVLTIGGKTYTRVPGGREYVEAGAGPGLPFPAE